MNNRITELREKAWDLVQIDLQTNERDEPISEREHTKMVFDKFAELIVLECADYFGREGDRRFEVDGNWIAKTIKKHFGVE